jgi:hypothetical protein
MQPLVALFVRNRRRLARLTLLAGALMVAGQLVPNWPREVNVEYVLGRAHGEIVELRVSYVRDDDELHGVSFGFPGGAPSLVRHRVTLPSGEFELRCELRGRGGEWHRLVRHLHAPADGPVRISLEGETAPSGHAALRRAGSRAAL